MNNKLVTATINGDTLPVKFWEGIPVVNVNYKLSESGAKKLARLFKKERRTA